MGAARAEGVSRGMVKTILIFLLHQFVGTVGVMALAGLVTSVVISTLRWLGWPIQGHDLSRILTQIPYFPVQITLALIFGWLLSRRFRHFEMLWVWVIPALFLGYLIIALPTTAAAIARDWRFSHFFGRECRVERHCFDQLGATLPFYVSVAYSLGALFARKGWGGSIEQGGGSALRQPISHA
jgi:hypothetical protein